MPLANIVLVNVSGGELSPEMYARLDLPIYQRGNQRIQNYIVLSSGGALYRNGFQHACHTKNLEDGRLITFTFSEQDTYTLCLTNRCIRFMRNFGVILNDTSKVITGVTRANPAVVSSTAHGLVNGQEIYIGETGGMGEINGQFFRVANAGPNSFELQNLFGEPIDSTNFRPYTSGGVIRTIFELESPYRIEHIKELHVKQSADTITITHQKYTPFELTRSGHTNWKIKAFPRTSDPFNQKGLTSITKANPGVFTTDTAHGYAVDDEVFVVSPSSMVELNYNWYKVNTVPSTTTLTLKDRVTGVPLNTSTFNTYVDSGFIIQTKYCPKTLAYLDSIRLGYGNWEANPAGMAFSRAPDPNTGLTRFNDFTPGALATESVRTTISPIFDKMDSVQWMANVNRQVVIGCLSSIRRLSGDTSESPISPSSVNNKPINSVGAAPIQPFSSGQSIFYVDGTGRRLHTFLFTYQTSDFVTVNQNLASNQLGSAKFAAIAQQRGDSGLLWVLREDGVLLGLTFNELESIFGWHRHYIGGKSMVNGVKMDRAKVLSVATEPRLGDESVLWAIIERTVNGKTYRSIEYLNQPVRFVEAEEFISGEGYDAQKADERRYNNATFEQLKDSIHLDSAITYDGSQIAPGITMTPSAVTGDTMTLTASGSFFDTTMIGKQVWKKYDIRGYGGGRAEITGIASATQAFAKVLSPFDNTATIAEGRWSLTADRIYGLLHLVGETVDLQIDGAPGGKVVVQPDGSVILPGQASKVHAGYSYVGRLTTMNLDVAGERGSNEAKIRKIRQVLPRVHNTIGAKIGTTFWNVEPVVFKTVDDLTDRPTKLYSGILDIRPSDSWTRQTKQVVWMQDIPSPQLLLSLDIELEVSLG